MQVVCFDYSNSKFELVRHLALNLNLALALALARNDIWSKSKKKENGTDRQRRNRGSGLRGGGQAPPAVNRGVDVVLVR